MYWYIAHVNENKKTKLVKFFNSQENTKAFIPKMEKWYSMKGIKDYIIKDLYPDYVFIKSPLDMEEFNKCFKEFFETVDGFAQLLEYDDVYPLSESEQSLMEKLFDNQDVIKHSVGNIVNSQLIVDEGPLMNMEDKVIKINRHHRIATLKTELFNNRLIVPLEVISKT